MTHLTETDITRIVRMYAIQNYETGEGWDRVVEYWTDQDILSAVPKDVTPREAVMIVGDILIETQEYLD